VKNTKLIYTGCFSSNYKLSRIQIANLGR